MRMNVISGFGSGPVWLCQNGSGDQSLCISEEDGVPVIPVFPEFIGQHFCLIEWEEERIYRGGPHTFDGGFPRWNRCRNIVFGRLVSASWPGTPVIAWCLGTEPDRHPTERIDVSSGTDLSAVLRSCGFCMHHDKNMLCLGDEDCRLVIEETSGFGQSPVRIYASVWADVFMAMPEKALSAPDVVRKALCVRYRAASVTKKRIETELMELEAKREKLHDELREVDAVMAKSQS